MAASVVPPDTLTRPASVRELPGLDSLHHAGNSDLLRLHKVAFLCSRICPEQVAASSYEWAVLQRDSGVCVISGFQSPIEKGVFQQLLKGTQPIIVTLARGIRRPVEPTFAAALDAGRLLILSRYAESVTHACQDKCLQRNRLMIELADEVVIAHAASGGNLDRLCREYHMVKQFSTL